VKEIAGGFVRLGEKATEVLRRLEERPGFPFDGVSGNFFRSIFLPRRLLASID
jgi:hypothetical protein